MAKAAQIDFEHGVLLHAQARGHAPRGVDFAPVALAVVERQGV